MYKISTRKKNYSQSNFGSDEENCKKQSGTEEEKKYKKRRSVEVEEAFEIIKNNWNYNRIHKKEKMIKNSFIMLKKKSYTHLIYD